MNYIIKIETHHCDGCGTSAPGSKDFDIIYLEQGPVIVVTPKVIAIFPSAEGYEKGTEDPTIIDMIDDETPEIFPN